MKTKRNKSANVKVPVETAGKTPMETAEKQPVEKPKGPMDLEWNSKVNVPGVLSCAVDKFGAKRVLKCLGYNCLIDNIHMTVFPSSMFATEKNAEALDVGITIRYVLDNWEEMSKEALKHWVKLQKARSKSHEA